MDRLTDFTIYRKARALGAYWDAVVHSAPAPALPPEDVALGEIIRRIDAAMDADRRSASPSDPLLVNLLAKHQEMNTISTTTLSPPVGTVPSPRAHPWPISLPEQTRSRPRYQIAAILVAAAVILLAVGLALGPLDWRDDPGRRTAVPAAVAPDASPDATPAVEPVEFLWQTKGDPADPMENATNLAIAPDGSIWVPDGRNGRFQIFSPDGELLEIWGSEGTGDGQFDFLLGGQKFGGYGRGAIAFAPDGSFYVADTGNHRIQKFGPDRTFVTAWGSEGTGDGQFAGASDLAVDGQGRVYVVDAYRGMFSSEADAVQVFDADGRFLASWGTQGFEPGQLQFATGIAVDRDGTILVAAYDNNRVQRFTPEGKFLNGWGEIGIGEGQISGPFDVAVDAEGHIVEVEYDNSRVQVFDRDGRFLLAWGGIGTDDGEFTGPVAVAVDGAGNVYVTDDAGRLQKFHIASLPEPGGTPTVGVSLEPSGDEVLVAFPLPADVLPDGGRAAIGCRYLTIPANSSTNWNGTSGEIGPGLWGDYIVSGSLTMTSEAVVDVIRGGTRIQESVPAGTEIELAPGDTVLHRIQHSKTWVAGPETVNIVSWYVRELPWRTYVQPGGWTEVDYNLSDNTQIMPGTNTIRFVEALMQPEVRRPDPDGDAVQIGVMLPQDPAYLIQGGDRSLRVAGTENPATVYILIIEPSGSATPAAGTPEP